MAQTVTLVAAATIAAVGVVFGTWGVGGSDSSCYALMAQAFAEGRLQPSTPLAREAPWPDAPRTFAPGGFIPSPVRTEAASPVCAPGFAVLLAPIYVVGGPDAIFLVTPVAGALLVWLTFRIGRALSGPAVGAAAAVLVAAMPVLLFQVVQLMNDVVTAAAWTAVVAVALTGSNALASAASPPADSTPRDSTLQMLTLGAITGLALLVRPSLAPAAAIVGAWCWWRGGLRASALFALAAAPFVAVVALLNVVLYGGVLESGYGDPSHLFSAAHVPLNIRNYSSALFATQLGFPMIGAVACRVAPSRVRPAVWLALGIAAAIIGLYLLYRPFPEWWYLRFLLPVLPVMTALAVAVVSWLSRSPWSALIVAVVVAGYSVATPQAAEALGLWRLEERFHAAGTFVRDRLPERAAYLAVWQSGTVRYHAGREVLVWDSLDPRALETSIEWLRSRGFTPYILVEEWEEPLFRERFAGHSPVGGLDWPPRFDIGRRVRIFDPADRDAYMRGEHVPTELVATPRRR